MDNLDNLDAKKLADWLVAQRDEFCSQYTVNKGLYTNLIRQYNVFLMQKLIMADARGGE